MTTPKNGPSPAPEPEAVAPPLPAPTPAPKEKTVSEDVCADCGSSDIAGWTDGVSASRRCFCVTHMPGNVTATIS